MQQKLEFKIFNRNSIQIAAFLNTSMQILNNSLQYPGLATNFDNWPGPELVDSYTDKLGDHKAQSLTDISDMHASELNLVMYIMPCHPH